MNKVASWGEVSLCRCIRRPWVKLIILISVLEGSNGIYCIVPLFLDYVVLNTKKSDKTKGSEESEVDNVDIESLVRLP
jgi:hypothetical protein